MSNLLVADLPRTALAAARELLARSSAFDPAADVAEEKLFGPSPTGLEGHALAAWQGDQLVGVAAQAGRWLRLIAVDPERRRQGIGHALLDEVIRRARGGGAGKLRVGDQPGNYLAPGVDERNGELIEWLEKRGFQWWGANANLRVALKDNPLVTLERAGELIAHVDAAGFEIRRGESKDADTLHALATAFLPSWAFEAALALPEGGVHVAYQKATGRLVGFAVHDGNNRGLGWFGPAGVDQAFRGRGIGAALLLPCLLDVAARGAEHATIAWVGPQAFYEKLVGAVDDRHFVVMERPL